MDQKVDGSLSQLGLQCPMIARNKLSRSCPAGEDGAKQPNFKSFPSPPSPPSPPKCMYFVCTSHKNEEAITLAMASYSQAPLLGLEPRTYPDESGSAALTNSGENPQTNGRVPVSTNSSMSFLLLLDFNFRSRFIASALDKNPNAMTNRHGIPVFVQILLRSKLL